MTLKESRGILSPINALVVKNAASMAQASKEGNMQKLDTLKTGTVIEIVNFLGTNPEAVDTFLKQMDQASQGGKK